MSVKSRIRNNGLVFAVLLWLLLGLFNRLLFAPIIPIANKSEQQLKKDSVTPFAYFPSGTFGQERDDGLHWMKDKNVVYRISNPLKVPVSVDSYISISSDPCGNIPRLQSIETGLLKNRIATNDHGISVQTVLRAKEVVNLTLKFKDSRCVISTDPRIFAGSLIAKPLAWAVLAS